MTQIVSDEIDSNDTEWVKDPGTEQEVLAEPETAEQAPAPTPIVNLIELGEQTKSGAAVSLTLPDGRVIVAIDIAFFNILTGGIRAYGEVGLQIKEALVSIGALVTDTSPTQAPVSEDSRDEQ